MTQRACWSPGSAGNREENYNFCFISGYKHPVCLMPPAPTTRPLGRRIIFLCLPTGLILAKPAKSSSQPAFQDISSVQACRSHAVYKANLRNGVSTGSQLDARRREKRQSPYVPPLPVPTTDSYSQSLHKQTISGCFCGDANSIYPDKEKAMVQGVPGQTTQQRAAGGPISACVGENRRDHSIHFIGLMLSLLHIESDFHSC